MTSHGDDSTTLECGRDLLALVEQVTDDAAPSDPQHQATCPFCQEALCRLRTANGELRRLAGEEVRAPRGLARRVMAQLRHERGRVPLAGGRLGADTVSDLVILQIVRRSARSVDGVVHCSIELEPATADGELSLVIHLTAEFGPALPDLANAVRRAVAREILELTGLRTGPIVVSIDDVAV